MAEHWAGRHQGWNEFTFTCSSFKKPSETFHKFRYRCGGRLIVNITHAVSIYILQWTDIKLTPVVQTVPCSCWKISNKTSICTSVQRESREGRNYRFEVCVCGGKMFHTQQAYLFFYCHYLMFISAFLTKQWKVTNECRKSVTTISLSINL